MSTQYIVVFGTVSLQRYIFQSNRLKENIGASYLAKYWLSDGLIKATKADTAAWDQYVDNPLRNPLENPVDTDKDINVIYVGGGNAALLCKDRDIAQAAVKTWSRKLLAEAPGLRIAVGYGKVSCSLAAAYRTALDKLNLCEEALPFGATLYSLPVVRTCISTGLPASERSKEPGEGDRWISYSATSKRNQVGSEQEPGPAQNHIADNFPSVLKKAEHLPELRFAIKLDEELGGHEGESHIAIVHADGNGMGERLNRVIDKENQEDDEFLHNLRAFSASTTNLSHKALEDTLLHLKNTLPLDSLHNPEDVFPLRPIVYGGDDLTFVCDGRVGLNLAAFYLKQFSNGTIRVCDKEESVDACAGVAIVPTKFPFVRAYGFADELCGLAKAHRRDEGNSKGSWLDFQIIQEGATRSIAALRDAQYYSLEGQKLYQRPYQVPEKWDDFVAILRKFRSSKWPRNRAKGLLQVLTQGPAVTQRFVEGLQWRGVELPSSAESDTGWTDANDVDRTTPYFDPLQALDFYLEELPAKSSATDGSET